MYLLWLRRILRVLGMFRIWRILLILRFTHIKHPFIYYISFRNDIVKRRVYSALTALTLCIPASKLASLAARYSCNCFGFTT